jgi:hypothetical protein
VCGGAKLFISDPDMKKEGGKEGRKEGNEEKKKEGTVLLRTHRNDPRPPSIPHLLKTPPPPNSTIC